MNRTWLIDPFRPAKGAPPQTLGAFMRWCLSGAWPALIIAAVASALAGGLEAATAWILGRVIDGAVNSGPEAFFTSENIALIIGAVVFTLLQTVLGLQTHLWELYLGVVFVGMVMFFPAGLSGIIMAHVPAAKMGKLGTLVGPYLTCVLPGIIGGLGLAALVEMIFHVRSGAEGEHHMVLFWTEFSTHDVLPWLVALGVAVIGIGLAVRNAPNFKAAWDNASTLPEAA